MAPRRIPLLNRRTVSHDAGVTDREVAILGTRWSFVEYGPHAGRAAWCSTPHVGYVVAGTITYQFQDRQRTLKVRDGDAFVLPYSPRHRGHNAGHVPARLFLIDTLPRGQRPSRRARDRH
ncbi:MAG: cupin domain-containing protein [Chloroflexi bacterium]|nr:cupin domain-containing protein [Chloroflexota bacterium]